MGEARHIGAGVMLDVQRLGAGNGHCAAPNAEHSGAAVECAVHVHGDISFHNDAGFSVVIPHLGDGTAQQVHCHVSVDHAAVGNVVDDLHITALHGEGDVVDAVGLGVAAHGHVAGNGGILVNGQFRIACGHAIAAQINLVVGAAFQQHGTVGSLVGIQFAAEDFQSACAGSHHAVGDMEFRPGVEELDLVDSMWKTRASTVMSPLAAKLWVPPTQVSRAPVSR